MRKPLLSSFIFFMSFNLAAQDCGNIPNGQVVRLDEAGGSLQNSKVQDQDGLGTCYANTASVLLQSAIPNNPDVSYINLALGYAEKHSANKSGSSYAYDSAGNMLITGGLVCETIQEAKKNGVCNRRDVPLENGLFHAEAGHFADNGHVQNKLLEKVSRYYDDVNREFNNGRKLQDQSSTFGRKTKFISPEAKEKITENVKSFSEKAGQFFTNLGNGFKKFFSAIFDRGNSPDNDQPNNNQVDVIDRSITDDNQKPSNDGQMADNTSQDPIGDFINNNVPKDEIPSEPEVIAQEQTSSPKSNPEEFSKEKFEALKKKKKLTAKEEYQLALYDLLQKNLPEYAKKNCERNDPKNSLDVAQNLAAMTYNVEQSGAKKPEFSILRFNLYGSYSTRGTGKTKVVEFNLNNKITQAAENDYFTILKAKPTPKSGFDAFTKALKKNLPNYISQADLEKAVAQLDPNLLSKLEDDYKRYALKDFSVCSKDKMAYLKNDDGLMKDFQSSPCLSRYQKLGQGIQELAVGLDDRNTADINRITDFILNSPDMNYEKSLTAVLSPTCSDENKIKIPQNLTCSDHHINFSSYETNTPQKEAKKLQEEKTKFRQNIARSLTNQKAIGVSLCTIFFQEDPNYSYNQNKNCNVSRSDGLHAVAITGYRCQNGKLDYLIQNSWGEWRDLNSVYERDRDSGKAWINEEAMVKNSYHYSILGN